ncbi:MAG: rhomboid family intramembrane serine protease [Spirochaetales bacterium]|nr:rhomboid family intramembrane serine protease [Spirochaetales bacterium]
MAQQEENKKGGFRLKYNAPVILSFALICSGLMLLDNIMQGALMQNLFSVPGNTVPFHLFSLDIIRLFTHAAGHANWMHLVGNFSFILLLGPILEERYGSGLILLLIVLTAFITGLINRLFFSTGLLGASGIVFMLILLISFVNVRRGEIPLTFVLVLVLYLGQEFYKMFFEQNNIAEMAHILGGACGGIFGFIFSANKAEGKSVEDVISV